MLARIWNGFGRQMAHKAIANHIQGSRLDVKLGFALLRDRRIPIWPKLLALGLGAALASLLVALEIPVESILAAVLPMVGLAIDFIADGMEALVMPIVFGALLLPFLAPRPIVDQIMAERAGGNLPPLPLSRTP